MPTGHWAGGSKNVVALVLAVGTLASHWECTGQARPSERLSDGTHVANFRYMSQDLANISIALLTFETIFLAPYEPIMNGTGVVVAALEQPSPPAI